MYNVNNADKEQIYKKLKQKADSIKNEFKDSQSKYDHYKLKNIIKENLIEIKRKNIFSDKNKYEEFLNEDVNIEDYLEEDNISEGNEVSEFNDHQIIDELNKLELNAINKAKELENQINYINNKRIDLIVRDFKEKLIQDSQEDMKSFQKILQDEYKSALKNINEEHANKLNSIERIQSKVNELEQFIKEINLEIRDEKIELNSAFEKYLNHMENEKNKAMDKYKVDMNIFIENRVKIFKSHLESKSKNKAIYDL